MKTKTTKYHDDFEQKADRLYRAYLQDPSKFVTLKNAAELYEKTTNPEGKQIALILTALYYRELGKREQNNQKASEYLHSAFLSISEASGPDSVEAKKFELAYLRRQLGASDLNKFPKSIVFRSAEIHRSLGNDSNYHFNMALYYMFSLTELQPYDDRLKEYSNLMVDHAKQSGNNELFVKANVMLHQIKASLELDPKLAVSELEEALQMIRQTKDRFGEKESEAKLNILKSMVTANKKKRQLMLESAAKTWHELGNKKEFASVVKMLSPIPVSVSVILNLANKTLEKHGQLSRKFHELVKIPSGPYAIFHHQSHLVERIKDIEKIINRLGENRKHITDLSIRESAVMPKNIRAGKPLPKNVQKLIQQKRKLTEQMKLDMESLYIFGNLLLDQWAHVIAYSTGLRDPEKFNFHSLYNKMASKKDKGILVNMWNSHRKDVYWLYYQLRLYRNIFIEHVTRPWQRGNTMSVYGDDFNLFVPTPPGWLNGVEIEKRLKEIFPLAPKVLREAPNDYWERKNLHRVLEVTYMNIDQIENQADREKVWNVWKEVGGSSPSYDIIAFRLINFINSSVDTMISIISDAPDQINLGKGAMNKELIERRS
jgi:hypothetical protein